MGTADKWKVALLVLVALIGTAWLVDLLFLSHLRHHDYTGDCGPAAEEVGVDLVGGYKGFSSERGVPYHLRLVLKKDDARDLIRPRLVSSSTGRILELPDMTHVEISGTYRGEIPTVWLAQDLSVPYETHVLAGTLKASAGRPTLKLLCRLEPTPREEWRVPLLDMLMSV